MAATVVSRNTGRTTASNTTSHTITMPATINAGDLLLVIFSSDGQPTCTAPSDWNKGGQATDGALQVTGAWFWKYAAGGDTCTITTSSSEQSSHVSFDISGSSTPTGTSATGSSTNSAPPAFNSGETSTLWIVTRSGDSTTVATAAPANYGNLQTQAAAGTSGASSNTAERTVSTNSETPGTFTSNSEQWVCWTLGFPDRPTNKPYITGYNGDSTANSSGKTFSVYIPFNNSTLIGMVSSYDLTEGDTRISSITYNGVAMTQLQKKEDTGGGDGASSYLYALTGLSAGTANLAITLVGACQAPNYSYFVISNTSSSLDGSDLDSIVSNTTPLSGSITTIADNCLVVSYCGFGAFAGTSIGSDQFQTFSGSSAFFITSYSKTIKTPAGVVTHTYTPSLDTTGDIFLASIKAPSNATGNFFSFFYP